MMGMKFWKQKVGDWAYVLSPILLSNYMLNLIEFLEDEYDKKIIYPDKKDIFKAFKMCQFKDTKVVIISNEPFVDGSSNGLAFGTTKSSINKFEINEISEKIQKSVEKNVHEGIDFNFDYTLESWSKQGVLLINTAFTVIKNKPMSHQKEWKTFVTHLIEQLNKSNKKIIYCLWGNHARQYKSKINTVGKYVLSNEHPISAIYGNRDWNCDHYTVINNYLKKPIVW